ncbi:MAG: hypothetical protein K1X65_15340 [Caldilineales bacterium]|nr:hypothetical protein [Caldilineales bacterium]MCW5860498.1 hypothetical protein [Caldilineales bacterium]
MIQRKTQNLAYWRDDYKVDNADHEFLYETLADATEPQSLSQLARAIIRRRCQQEESRIRTELTRGLIFDPYDTYRADDMVVFPAFEFRLAKVLAVRSGQNPEHGPFDVINVRFEGEASERMFAARLRTPHPLNRNGQEVKFSDEDVLTPDEIFDLVSDAVSARIEKHLQGNPSLFVRAGASWLTAEQMVQVNLGHLNIAEAAIEMNNKPVSTAALLDAIDLDAGSAESVRIFSLETALYGDDRFVEVGSGERRAWYLRRMMPAAALETPPALRVRPVSYQRSSLDVEMVKIEWELNDEWSEGGLGDETPAEAPSVSFHVLYPHLISGTLPLSASTRRLLPHGSGQATEVTLIDGRWGGRIQGWVSSSGRYVAGLGAWYAQHKLPVGARITLERTNNPGEVVIDFRPQRAKRAWVRTARVLNGRLTFELNQHQLACDYDDHLAMVVPDSAEIEAFRGAFAQRQPTIRQVVEEIMPELAKLSPQGTAHVKTLYSAVNVAMRLPPGPIFAALSQLPGATDTGSGFWSL